MAFNVAQLDLCRFVQYSSFSFLIDYLNVEPVSKEHRHELKSLKKLSPFEDDDGLIKVGGRLQRSSFEFDVRHPILLPKRNHLVKLIIRHYRKLSRHSGCNYVLSQIRQTFWIVNGQSAVRYYLQECLFYSLRHAKSGQQSMDPLALQRTLVIDLLLLWELISLT